MIALLNVTFILVKLFSFYKIASNPGKYFFPLETALEPMKTHEESQYDLMVYNPLTDSYEMSK
jgi:hypothetical protein